MITAHMRGKKLSHGLVKHPCQCLRLQLSAEVMTHYTLLSVNRDAPQTRREWWNVSTRHVWYRIKKEFRLPHVEPSSYVRGTALLKWLTRKIKFETRLTGKLENLQLAPGLRQGILKGKKRYSLYYQFHHILLKKISPLLTEIAVKLSKEQSLNQTRSHSWLPKRLIICTKCYRFFPCTLDFNKNVPS